MANFNTHIQFAAAGSGIGATGLLSIHQLSLDEALLCWCAGTLGGIMPDIDSDNSHSLSILFGILSFVTCVVAVVLTVNLWPLAWVWALCLGALGVIHLVIRPLFKALTIHRGVFHSILAVVLFAAVTSALAFQLGISAKTSWWLGLFMAFGSLLHLLLDEIYSVDFMNIEIKRSFGSAFKIFDYSNRWSALAFVVLIAGAIFLSPPASLLKAQILTPGVSAIRALSVHN